MDIVKSLREVTDKVVGESRFKGFRNQFDLMEAVLVRGPRLHLRGFFDPKARDGILPALQDLDVGDRMCQVLRQSVKTQLGDEAVAPGGAPVECECSGCHWESYIALGSAFGNIKIGQKGISLMTRTRSQPFRLVYTAPRQDVSSPPASLSASRWR